MTRSLGIFDNEHEDAAGKDERQFAGRIVFQPLLTDDSVFHIGLSYLLGNTSPNARQIISDRFGVHSTSDKFTLGDTEVNDVSQYGLELAWRRGAFSVQMDYLSARWGAGKNAFADAGDLPGYLELGDANLPTQTVPATPGLPDGCSSPGDAACAVADVITGVTYARSGDLNTSLAAAGELNATGYTFQIAYTLTGEMRSYKQASGVFDRVSPRKGGPGAWELVLRYENLDADTDKDSLLHQFARTEIYNYTYTYIYTDTDGNNIINGSDTIPDGVWSAVDGTDAGTATFTEVRGTSSSNKSAEAITLGLNWIPNKNIRLMANT